MQVLRTPFIEMTTKIEDMSFPIVKSGTWTSSRYPGINGRGTITLNADRTGSMELSYDGSFRTGQTFKFPLTYAVGEKKEQFIVPFGPHSISSQSTFQRVSAVTDMDPDLVAGQRFLVSLRWTQGGSSWMGNYACIDPVDIGTMEGGGPMTIQ